MQQHHITVNRTARYFTLGEVNDNLHEVWFVLHGQGHLADRFLREFRSLNDGSRLIVAPEGLSRFYLDGNSGHVGASWMTKEDRLTEINDYLLYLDTLYFEIAKKFDREKVRVCVLGFSQGAATASRWACLGGVKPDALVLWGGAMAHDLDLEQSRLILQNVRLSLVYGTQDKYVDPARIAEERSKLEAADIPYHWISFEGGHEIDQEVLARLTDGDEVIS